MINTHVKVNVIAGGIVEKDGKVLVVREPLKLDSTKRLVITQPSGHVEEGESFEEALVRETMEESGYKVRPTAVVGVYLQRMPTYHSIRVTYACELVDDKQQPITDEHVMEAVWMTPEELKTRRGEYRPGATAVGFDDYFAGKRYPLEVVKFIDHLKNS